MKKILPLLLTLAGCSAQPAQSSLHQGDFQIRNCQRDELKCSRLMWRTCREGAFIMNEDANNPIFACIGER